MRTNCDYESLRLTEERAMHAKHLGGVTQVDEDGAHLSQARRVRDVDPTVLVGRQDVDRWQRHLERDQFLVELEHVLVGARRDPERLVRL